MKSVLMLAYRYPPCKLYEVGGQRPQKFAKYLPQFGWRPILITRLWEQAESQRGSVQVTDDLSRDGSRFHINARLLKQWSGRQPFIVRVPCKPYLYVFLSEKLNQLSRHFILLVPLRKIFSMIRGWTLLQSPWIKHAKTLADEIIAETPIDAIFATLAPAESLYLATKLSRKHRIPLIIDFRDEWKKMYPYDLVLRLYAFRARRCLRSAAKSIQVTQELAETESKYLKSPMEYIPNGFDHEEYEFSPPEKGENDPFSLVFTGTFAPHSSLIWRGIRLFIDENSELINPDVFRFYYYGLSTSYILEQVKKYDIESFASIHSLIPRQEALVRQKAATVLLLHTYFPGLKGFATGKIYEYFGARRPILAVPGRNSTIEALLSETQAGRVVSSEREVAECLLQWFLEWRRTGDVAYQGVPAALLRYTRKKQTQKLAGLLDQISS